MTRLLSATAAAILLGSLSACATPYYEITDPTTDKVYYTGSDIATRYPESGAIRFEDARTGKVVTLASHEIRPLTEAEFTAAVNDAAAPPESDQPN